MSMRPDDKDDRSGNIIRIRGLPRDATKQEICDFFYGVNIVNGENGIHSVNRATNNIKPLCEVYIELASYGDLQRAKTFHEKSLGKQYIEVFESSFHEFQSIMNKQRGAKDESPRSTECRNNIGGRNSKKRNVQPNGNNRMHPYGRSGGKNFGHGPNKGDCDVVDAEVIPSDEQLPPTQEEYETLSLRVEALETLTNFLRNNNENFRNRITALENAGRQCDCGAMNDVINPQV